MINLFAGCVVIESVFELVSNEDQAKMEAAKMQAELAQSQQQKHVSSATDGLSASGKACTDGQDSRKHDASVASPVNTITSSSQTVKTSDNVDSAAAVAPFSSRQFSSHAGFSPFAKNPAKQKRYEAYLESVKAGTSCKFAAVSEALFKKQTIVFN